MPFSNRPGGRHIQAPRNYSRGERNLPKAQKALDHTIARANRQLIEAINVDGIDFLHWTRSMQGMRCTCMAGDSAKEITPVIPSIPNEYGEDGDFSFKVRGYNNVNEGHRSVRNDLVETPRGKVFGLDTDAENRDSPFTSEYVDEDEEIDLLNSEPLASIFDGSLLSGGSETRCGICIGTGMTEGYTLTRGKRIILATQDYTSSGIEVDTQTKPHSFYGPSQHSSYVQWHYELPTYFLRVLSISVRNNINPADNVELLYSFDGEDFQPLTLDVLNARNGLATKLYIRARPTSNDNANEARFTHIEINMQFDEFQKLQMPNIVETLNVSIFETIPTTTAILPPTVQVIRPGDYIYESKNDRLWKAVENTGSKTSKQKIFGWESSVRGLLPDDVGHVLRIVRDPTFGLAYTKLEMPRTPTFSREDAFNFAKTQQADIIKARRLVTSLNLGPVDGEFFLDPQIVIDGNGPVNRHTSGLSDLHASVSYIKEHYPNCKMLWLSPVWYANVKEAGELDIKPYVTNKSYTASIDWEVQGHGRASGSIEELPQYQGMPISNGTINDKSLIAAIIFLHASGFKVGLRPVVYGAAVDSFYSKDITADEYDVSYDSEAFFGEYDYASDYDEDLLNVRVTATNTDDWGYTRFIYHYAHIAHIAGGVDAFLIGSDFRKLTRHKAFVEKFTAIADVIKSELGCLVSYEASIYEYGAIKSEEQIDYPLDNLWANPNIDFVAIKYDARFSDWRNTKQHLDKEAGFTNGNDIYYLQSQILGGEGYTFNYESPSDRNTQTRTLISDSRLRYKDVVTFWENDHYETDGDGVTEMAPTSWEPKSKPIAFTDLSVPAIKNGTNDLSVTGYWLETSPQAARDDLVQYSFMYAFLSYWREKLNTDTRYSKMVASRLNSVGYFFVTNPGVLAIEKDNMLNPLKSINGRF